MHFEKYQLFFKYLLNIFIDKHITLYNIRGPTRGGAQTGILRFTMQIFVYKWLLLILILLLLKL